MSGFHTDTSVLSSSQSQIGFTNGICDLVYAPDSSLSLCAPLALNAIFCPYCLLARQAAALSDDDDGRRAAGTGGYDADSTSRAASLHWTCLTAAAIDVGQIVAGALNWTLWVGAPVSGLAMQALITRHLVRTRLGIAPDSVRDLLVSLLLPCCAAAQHHMELELRRHRGAGSNYAGLLWGEWALVRRPILSRSLME